MHGGFWKPACAGFVFQIVCSLLTVTPGLLSFLNRLKGAHERELCGCDGVCVGTGRVCLAARAGLFGGSRKPAGADFLFSVVNSLCRVASRLFIWSEFPSKKLKEGGKSPKIALSRLNFASFGPKK